MLRVEYDVGRSQSICVPALCMCRSAENEHSQMKIKRVEEYCEITNLLAENAHTTTTARQQERGPRIPLEHAVINLGDTLAISK